MGRNPGCDSCMNSDCDDRTKNAYGCCHDYNGVPPMPKVYYHDWFKKVFRFPPEDYWLDD